MGEYKEPQCVVAAPRNLLKADIPAGCIDRLLGELPASGLAENQTIRSIALNDCSSHIAAVETGLPNQVLHETVC